MQEKNYIVATCDSSQTGIDIDIYTGTRDCLVVLMLNKVLSPLDAGEKLLHGTAEDCEVVERNGKYTAYAAYAGENENFSVTCSAVENPYNSHEIDKVCQDGNRIVASINDFDPEYKEIFVGVQTPSGDYQDLVIVGEKYHYSNDSDGPVPDHNTFTVKVYGDSENEDFTEEFTIPLAKEIQGS